MKVSRKQVLLALMGGAGLFTAAQATRKKDLRAGFDMDMPPWADTAPELANYKRGERPNILLIMSDQERARQDLPGSLDLPNHDRLHATSTEYADFHVTTAPCSPSRSVFYTGLHTKFTNVTGNPGTAGSAFLDKKTTTIGDILREEGYYTAYKGKWHLAPLYADTSKLRFSGMPEAFPIMANAMEQYGFSDFTLTGDIWGGAWDGFRNDAAIAAEASRWLLDDAPRIAESRPWMLAVNFVNPHDIMFFSASQKQERTRQFQNLLQPIRQEPYSEPYNTKLGIPLPESLADDLSRKPWLHSAFRELNDLVFGKISPEDTDAWAVLQNYYFNCIRDLDTYLGVVLDALEASGEDRNTIIIYTSDHGELAGAHGLREKGPCLYRENVRVPFLVRHPDIQKGKKIAAMGSALDLAPTLLNWAGVDEAKRREKYPDLKGCDLTPALEGNKTERDDRGMLFYFGQTVWLDPALTEIALSKGPQSNFGLMTTFLSAGRFPPKPDPHLKNQMRGIYDGRYKLGRYFSMKEHNMPATLDDLFRFNEVELYDTHLDPNEMNNLANQPDLYRDVLSSLNTQMNFLLETEIGVDDGSEFKEARFVS